MNALKIILSTLGLAIAYGIIHDMITAHLCVEYFTIGHPKIIDNESPILLALLWGLIASWWIALPMGLLLASVNHFGSFPKLEAKIVIRLVLQLLCWMFVLALVAGIIGFVLTELKVIHLLSPLAEQINPEKHSLFLADGWAHVSSYLSGIVGTVILCLKIWKKRKSVLS